MTTAASEREVENPGKQVSFVELYLDLVFVLAVGQLAHLIVDAPRLHTVLTTLGLFVALWWTWVGLTVLHNRHGRDRGQERLLFLAASVPVGVAAVAVKPASDGHITAFAVSLALTRVLLALGNARDDDPNSPVGDVLRRRTARAFAASAVLFTGSIWVPEPFTYLFWAAAYLHESRVMLTSDHGPSRSALHSAPTSRASLSTHTTSPSGSAVHHHPAGRGRGRGRRGGLRWPASVRATWSGLVAAMVLAATFWWSYFDAAAEIDLDRLKLSGDYGTFQPGSRTG